MLFPQASNVMPSIGSEIPLANPIHCKTDMTSFAISHTINIAVKNPKNANI